MGLSDQEQDLQRLKNDLENQKNKNSQTLALFKKRAGDLERELENVKLKQRPNNDNPDLKSMRLLLENASKALANNDKEMSSIKEHVKFTIDKIKTKQGDESTAVTKIN